MTWSNHPRNFHTLDIANGDQTRYMNTIVPHTNVLNVLYQRTAPGDRVSVQDLKLPIKDFYQWTTSSKLCREMKDNNFRFKYVEETCLNHVPLNKSVEKLQTVETNFMLSTQVFKDFPVFIHLITNNGLVDSLGNVYTGSLLIVPQGCDQRLPFAPGSEWKVYVETNIQSEVFVMSQFYNKNPFGFMIDSLPRIVPYLKFLWEHKDVKLHVQESVDALVDKRIRDILAVLGIAEERLISGHVKSELIYLPQGGGCNTPNAYNIQTLQQLFISTSVKLSVWLQIVTQFYWSNLQTVRSMVLVQWLFTPRSWQRSTIWTCRCYKKRSIYQKWWRCSTELLLCLDPTAPSCLISYSVSQVRNRCLMSLSDVCSYESYSRTVQRWQWH